MTLKERISSYRRRKQALEAELEKLLEEINATRAAKRIRCPDCEKHHTIGKSDGVEVWWWMDARHDGSYLVPSELRLICPNKGTHIRLLVHKNKNKERERFFHTYRDLFKTTKRIEKSDGGLNDDNAPWMNTDEVDKRIEDFLLEI